MCGLLLDIDGELFQRLAESASKTIRGPGDICDMAWFEASPQKSS